MVILGSPVVVQQRQLGDDGAAEDAAGLDLVHKGLDLGELRGVGAVDAAAVLRPDVIALAVQAGGVVDQEHDFQDLAQADLRGVKNELDDFVVAAGAATDIFVTGLRDVAVAVAGLDIEDAAHLHENRLAAPEAARAQGYGWM